MSDHALAGTSCTINRLFGLNGRERLWVDIDHAIDEANDVAAWGDMPKPPPVEEWDAYPPAYHLPDAEWAAESAAEHACCTDMTEDGGDEWWALRKDPEVIAAFQAALDVLASKVAYRVARNRIAIWDPPIEKGGEWVRRPLGNDSSGGDAVDG